MTTADTVFAQADTNHDQQLDLNEFRSVTGGNLTSLRTVGDHGSPSSYQTSSYESSAIAAGDGTLGDAQYGSSPYDALSGNTGNPYNAGNAAEFSSTSSTATASVQQYETDAKGLFKDSNPQIVRRPAPEGNVTYTQKIQVRFLQPPPIPPQGPLIIKEVRPPQLPPPPPLRVRQQAPPLPQPPPLILRERPPPIPASTAAQTVIRRLSALPVPPRSVIIERLPALPAKPRDIIIERWIPYGAAAKRKTIVQRAPAPKGYEKPRNIIIQYEAPQVRVVRQFQRLGVTQENPQTYLQQYGTILLDSQTLLQQARAAGVVEDIVSYFHSERIFKKSFCSHQYWSPPAVAGSVATSSSQKYASSTGNYEADGLTRDISGLDASGFSAGNGAAASYESSSYSASGDVSGLGAGFADANLGGGGGVDASSYESSSFSSSTDGTPGAFSDVAFAAADVNQDGVLSQGEFRAAGY